VQLVDGLASVDKVTIRDENKVVWLSQTTLSVDETMEIVYRLRRRFPTLQDPPSDDICYATRTVRSPSRRWRPSASWSSSSGRAIRRIRCGWSRWRWARRQRRAPGRLGRRHRSRVVGRRHHGRRHFRRIRSRNSGTGRAGAAGRLRYGVVQPVTTAQETLVFALPREIRKPRPN